MKGTDTTREDTGNGDLRKRVATPMRQRASANATSSFATTLARGLAVLSAFHPNDQALSNSELATRTGMTRPTVFRLTSTLTELGFLRRDPKGGYHLGTQVLRIAYPLLATMDVRQQASPLMREFATRSVGAVSLAMPVGRDAIYVQTERASDGVAHIPEIGFSVPLAQTAVGRALLSLYSDEEFEAYDKEMQLNAPENWEYLRQRVLAGIQQCHTRGYTVAPGEWRTDVLGVAAPLFRTDTGECLAVNCGMPSYRFSADEVEHQFGPRMEALARTIRRISHTSETSTG